MSRIRRKQARYGLASGALAFTAGWAVAAFLTPETVFEQYPRWRTTIWMYLGAHYVELSTTHTGGLGLATIQPLDVAEIPQYIYYVPILVTAVSAFYTCYNFNSTRIKHNISNAFAAATGYVLIGFLAMVLADPRPSFTMMLLIALVIGGGIWLGSSLLGSLTRGVPFFGVASLGTVAMLGILFLLGGVALLSVVWGLLAIPFGAAGVAGTVVGLSRRLKRRGDRYDVRFPRLRGLQSLLADFWLELIVSMIVVAALLVGLNGGM